MHGAAERPDPITSLEVSRFGEPIHDLGHGIVVEHAGDAVGHSGHDFTPPGSGQVSKDEINDRPPYVCKGVAVEKEEGSPAMTLPQELYGFVEGGDFCLSAPPLCFKRCIAL